MIEKEYYVAYFKLYLKKILNEREHFFVSFCDVDTDVFEVLDYDTEAFGKEIRIVFLDKGYYDEAVRIRNNKSEKKVVILTSKSIKGIDSLKHFCEYKMFPDKGDAELIWEIIKELFNIKGNEKLYKKHFITIIKNMEIAFSQLMNYIIRSMDQQKCLNILLLNDNLNLLGCWKADNHDKLIDITTLRKIIRSSDPLEIRKRLDNISQSDSKLQSRVKKDIEKLIFDMNYNKLLEKYNFSIVSSCFRGKRRGGKTSEQNDDPKQIKFSFQDYLGDKNRNNSLNDLEDEIKSCGEDYFDDSKYSNLNEAYARFINIEIKHSELLNKISVIEKIFQENSFNIRPEMKETFLNLLNELKTLYIEFYEIIENKIIYPFSILQYTEKAYPFAQKYFEILKYIWQNNVLHTTLCQLKIFDEIQNLFLIHTETSCIMPFFHPIFITYLLKILHMYKEVENLLEENADRINELILNGVFEGIMSLFPIKSIASDGKIYHLQNNHNNMPLYVEFVELMDTLSISYVEPNLLYKIVEKYICKHPYLSEVNMLVIGNLNIETIGTLENKIKNLSKLENNLLCEVIITLIANKPDEIKKQIDSLFSNDNLSNRIKFKIITKVDYLKKEFSNIITDNHIVFILDSQFLYADPKLQEISNNKNSLINRISKQDLQGYVEQFIDDETNDIALIWDTLQNIYINNNSNLARWYYGQLNAQTFGNIVKAVKQKDELEIVVFSSNVKIANNIFIPNELYQATFVNSKSGPMVQISFSGCGRSVIQVNNDNMIPICSVSIKDLIETVIFNGFDEESLDLIGFNSLTDLKDFMIRFSLKGSKIIIEANVPEEQEETVIDDEYKNFIITLFKFAYQKERNVYSDYLRNSLSNQMYSTARSYADSFLCLYINKYYYVSDIDIEIANEDFVLDENGFDCYTAKRFCEFIDNNELYNEATIYEFKQQFENEILKEAQWGSEQLFEINFEFANKIYKLIGGVQ